MSSRLPIIGILTADSAPYIGGIGRHVDTLATGLRDAGETVQVFDIRRVPAYRVGRNILASLCMEPAVTRWIARERIGLLHIHGGPGGVLPWNRRWRGVPVVCTANHTYLQQASMPGQYWKRLLVPWERRGYAAMDHVACISADTQDVLVQRYGIPRQRTSVIDCGFPLQPWIAADALAADRDRQRCVFVGRPQVRKGWDVLRCAWNLVRQQCPQAVLSVVGWQAAPECGMTFCGRLDDAALRTLVGSARMLITPSRLEGFGLAAAEAIAAGTPVVGFTAPGLRSTVTDGVTGLLCRNDPALLASSILTLLNDDDGWRRLHEGCRNQRSRFAGERETQAYRSLFCAVYSRP